MSGTLHGNSLRHGDQQRQRWITRACCTKRPNRDVDQSGLIVGRDLVVRTNRSDIRGPPGGESSLLLAERHQQHDEFEPVPRAKLVECTERSPPPRSLCVLLTASLLDELPFKLAWAAGAERPSGGALAGGEAALISFDAEAAPVLNAKTCEVRRGCLTHDSSRTMPRRRSAADHAERAMLFLTAQNLRRSGPELAAVQ